MTNKNEAKHQDQKRHKTYSIIVNGRPRDVEKHELSYMEVVQLAYPGEQPSDTVVFTVTYSDPHGKDGTLIDGCEVKVKKGMIFNVKKTDQA